MNSNTHIETVGTQLRATLSNGVLIEAPHYDGIVAGIDGWNSFVLKLEIIDGDGNVVCPCEIPAELEERDNDWEVE